MQYLYILLINLIIINNLYSFTCNDPPNPSSYEEFIYCKNSDNYNNYFIGYSSSEILAKKNLSENISSSIK